jgi:hypothetical protein
LCKSWFQYLKDNSLSLPVMLAQNKLECLSLVVLMIAI